MSHQLNAYQEITKKSFSSGSLGNFLMGSLYVWPSYTLQLYTDRNTKLISSPMNDMESSLVGSLPPLGAMVGSAIVGWIISVYGRQKGALIIAIPMVVSFFSFTLYPAYSRAGT